MRDRFWTCADGSRVMVSDLQTDHIIRILAMMDKRPGWRTLIRPRLELELLIRRLGLRG